MHFMGCTFLGVSSTEIRARSADFSRTARRTTVASPLLRGSRLRVVKSLGLVAGNAPTCKALKRSDSILILLRNKADRLTYGFGTPRTADTVDIILVMGWKVIIYDMGNPVDINASGRDVGGHQNTDFSFAKFI
jgi:hypothetical protein